MLPSTLRPGSLRQRSRSTRSTVRKHSFRDDIGLVAIRYEKMAQGEAPTPIKSVNPVRTPTSPSRPASVTAISPSSASASPSLSSSSLTRSPSDASSSYSTPSPPSTAPSSPSPLASPIVVVRPPPTEEHPALRGDRKRDSAHAPASLSSRTTPTIDEEEEEAAAAEDVCGDGDEDYQYYRHMRLRPASCSATPMTSPSAAPAAADVAARQPAEESGESSSAGEDDDQTEPTPSAPSTFSDHPFPAVVVPPRLRRRSTPVIQLDAARNSSSLSLPASSPSTNLFPSKSLRLRTSTSESHVRAQAQAVPRRAISHLDWDHGRCDRDRYHHRCRRRCRHHDADADLESTASAPSTPPPRRRPPMDPHAESGTEGPTWSSQQDEDEAVETEKIEPAAGEGARIEASVSATGADAGGAAAASGAVVGQQASPPATTADASVPEADGLGPDSGSASATRVEDGAVDGATDGATTGTDTYADAPGTACGIDTPSTCTTTTTTTTTSTSASSSTPPVSSSRITSPTSHTTDSTTAGGRRHHRHTLLGDNTAPSALSVRIAAAFASAPASPASPISPTSPVSAPSSPATLDTSNTRAAVAATVRIAGDNTSTSIAASNNTAPPSSASPPLSPPLWKRGRSLLLRRNDSTSTSPSTITAAAAPPTSTSQHTTATASDTATTASHTPLLDISIPSDTLVEDDFIAGLNFSQRGSVILDADNLDGHGNGNDDDRDNGDDMATRQEQEQEQRQPPSTGNPPPRDDEQEQHQRQHQHQHQHQHQQSTKMTTTNHDAEPTTTPDPNTAATDVSVSTSQQPALPDIRVMAADADRESLKVRSLYAVGGSAMRWEDGATPSSSMGDRPKPSIAEHPAEEDEGVPSRARTHLSPVASTSINSFDSSSRRPSISDGREAVAAATAAAGGFEDWDDLDGLSVDRYGFITAPPLRPASSRLATPTELKSSQFSTRRRNILQKRSLVAMTVDGDGNRIPTRKTSTRSLYTQHSAVSMTSVRSSRSVIRQASNLLPHNRHRRWMDEAGDMLTVAPSMQDVAEEARVEKISEALKRKEWERSEKWRKMATIVNRDGGDDGGSKNSSSSNNEAGLRGGGMQFEFDVNNPKLIERTWKGVPDCWRSAAWWSFLEASARSQPAGTQPSVASIIADFHRLQGTASADDVQIDLDVPRTISQHIMFRRRYRGGQRLLFRVLHALSIYFPTTGYVQGMAALAATLLCYFDEERCFVMLVRMWQLRGLERLYRPGFEGLMTGLDELESSWMDRDVAAKLEELGIDKTAYGTRWYLTLFNMSIPFAAQLRVWDVFLLLGGNHHHSANSSSSSRKKFLQQQQQQQQQQQLQEQDRRRPKTADPASMAKAKAAAAAAAAAKPPPTGLDVLHATSAALIHALREVLLDSDFENAMKALTAFTPIKDEDLLMKVARAEWKRRHKR